MSRTGALHARGPRTPAWESEHAETSDEATPPASDHGGPAVIQKTLAVLDTVADRGGASAREIADALGLPLPTVYRILTALVASDYLVHLKSRRRYELGYKLHMLGVSLHRQMGVPEPVRLEIAQLHLAARVAAYFAVYRGADVVVTFVADSPETPRLTPLGFGFHEAAHATAFGKIMLAGMSDAQRDRYLDAHGTPLLTPRTITDRAALDLELERVQSDGLAWEREEFVPGQTCAAVGVRNAAGLIVGSVAISSASAQLEGRESHIAHELRAASARLSRYFRSGATAD